MKIYDQRAVLVNEIFMITLTLISGYLLFFEMLNPVTPEQIFYIDTIDTSIALVFLSEFFIKLYREKDKKAFLRSSWWELLAAIPLTTPETQALRLLRLVRALRFFRIGAHAIIARRKR